MCIARCVALAVVLAVTSIAGAQMKTAFTIPLPSGPSTSEFYTAGAGDMYYTVGTEGRIYAVNLTDKKIQYTQHFEGLHDITGLFAFDGGMLLVESNYNENVVALGPHGQLLWVNGGILLGARKNAYTTSNGTLFVISNYALQTFSAIDLMTGKSVGATMDIIVGSVYPTEAILTIVTENEKNEIVCYEIPSLKKKWTIKAETFLLQTKDYLLVSRPNPNTLVTEVLVLNPMTVALISTLKNVSNINSNGNYQIANGDYFLAEIGFGDLAYFNLKTGKMVWKYTPTASIVVGFAVTDYSVAFISQTNLQFINTTDGTPMFVKKGVPYTEHHTVTASENGQFFQVANLQGYTSWNAKTGEFVDRNEMKPARGDGVPTVSLYHWGKYIISTAGDKVVAQESG